MKSAPLFLYWHFRAERFQWLRVVSSKNSRRCAQYGLLGGGEGHTAELTNRLALNPDTRFMSLPTGGSIILKTSPSITFPFLPFQNSCQRSVLPTSPGIKMDLNDFDIIHTHERIFPADLCTLHCGRIVSGFKKCGGKKQTSLFDCATMWMEKKAGQKTTKGCHKFCRRIQSDKR